VRSLANKWIRILYRCWKDHRLYDESIFLESQRRRGEVVRVVWTEFRAFLDGGAGCPGGGPKAAIHSGLDSALGSHPCVALSSYQAPSLYGCRG